MRWNTCVRFAVLVSTSILCDAPLADDQSFQRPPIRVPDGFAVDLVAAPPLVKHPLMAGFDDRGRLFVAASAGRDHKRPELDKVRPNFIRMLEDTDGDGVFDESTIFADKMILPQGALWHDGALYVADPPGIWRLEDTDDDGVADVRQKIAGDFDYLGDAASVHGCFLGPAGRIYWCNGRRGHDIRTPDGQIVHRGRAACIVSCRTDGSDVRVHSGGAMSNPVEIDFTSAGDMLGTVNLFYKQRGDCLVHWLHGGVYPRYDIPACIDEFPSTGELLTEVHNLGHVAVSGLTRCRGSHLGQSYRDNFLITCFNTHKVVRAQLTPSGSTFSAQLEDFLVADSDDFHPTDVLQDADGSLLVIDTGGWFKFGCPTSQIAKPNILGAIYRIYRKGAVVPEDPRGEKIDWSSASNERLVELLGDDRFAVSSRAIAVLAKRGNQVLDALEKGMRNGSNQVRRNIAWVLARIGSPQAVALLAGMLADEQPSVRQAAAHGVTVAPNAEACGPLCELVTTDAQPAVRRAAAAALGRLRQPAAVPSLLRALREDIDRKLEHALIYALIEIADRDSTAQGLSDSNPRVRRAALLALDQMPDGNLTRDMVAPLLDTDDLALQQAAMRVIEQHSTWADEIVALLAELLAAPTISTDQQAMVQGALVAFSGNDKIQQLLAGTLARATTSDTVRILLLDVIGRSDVAPLPETWVEQLHHGLTSDRENVLRQAISTAAAAESSDQVVGRLLDISRDSSTPVDLRVSALAVVAQRQGSLDEAAFALLASEINDEVPPMRRLVAARAIGAAKLNTGQMSSATELVKQAGPLELAPLLAAFATDKDEVGQNLVAALAQSPGLTSLSAAQLEETLNQLSPAVRVSAASLIARLEAVSKDQHTRLDDLEQNLGAGDVERGQGVFMSKKAGCFACHRAGETGGRIGPDLSTIGASRSARDLLEAILFPNSSLARGFETYNITTDDGQVLTGLITRETADTIHLRTTQQDEARIPRRGIEEMLPGRVSIMPTGLDRTMTDEQLQDLLAFLRSLKGI